MTSTAIEIADDRFANTALAALCSTQARLADEPAVHFVRYQPDVSPFVVITGDPGSAVEELAARMQPGELEWMLHATGDPLLPAEDGIAIAVHCGVELGAPIAVGQMIFPLDAPISEGIYDDEVEALTGPGTAAEMLELTRIAFPGFFRLRTPAMGPYFGLRREGRLVAMGGDRMCFGPYVELSGVCTLPEFRGQGLATSIIGRILREHRNRGQRSYLHYASSNIGARRLYDQLGFQFTREVYCTRIFRPTI